MGAPKGNQFWKLRSQHGRDYNFSSAKVLEDLADEYFQWCVDNPLLEEDYRGKDATRVEIKKLRAFTYEGLTNYLRCNVQYFNDFERALKEKGVEETTDADKDFSSVIQYIRNTIRQQKFEGAAAGQLNANIIARDLGLADKTQVGGDPDNPLTPLQQIVVFQLPDNSRNSGLIE